MGHGKNESKNTDNVDREDREGSVTSDPAFAAHRKQPLGLSGFGPELLELCCWLFDSAGISHSCRGRKVRRSLHALKHKTGPMLESIGDGFLVSRPWTPGWGRGEAASRQLPSGWHQHGHHGRIEVVVQLWG